jgi:glycosyltransferase involved in cell wall biosynthesis
MKRPLISIVVPVYNEEENIATFWTEVNAAIAPRLAKYEFEFVFTDNHSTDGTFPLLSALAAEHPNVKVVRFSRNFGFQKSIFTGYTVAKGDAAIQLDVDLQDPPQLIGEFLRLWEEGYAVVYGVRTSRRERWVMRTARRIFYRLINHLSTEPLPLDAGDFRLVNRRVIDELSKHRDAHPYIRGSTATMGFRQAAVPYERSVRRFGATKFSMRQLFDLAIDGILNHSIVPLRIASLAAVVAGAGTVILIGAYIVGSFVFGQDWPRGFTTTTVLLLFSICLNALFLGIIGEYLGRIYVEVKQHPMVIVEATANCDPPI